MDSKAIKTIILFIVAMITVLIILITQVFMTGKIIDQNANETNNKKEEEPKVTYEINNTKTYKSLISKIDGNNFYIDMEVDKYTNEKIIVALKDNNIYVSSGNTDILSRYNTLYVINHQQKVIFEKANTRLEIRDIINIPKTDDYPYLKIIEGSEFIIDKRLSSEKIGNLEYFFDNEELKYIKNIDDEDDFYKINTISQVTDDNLFNLPSDYDIIDGSSIELDKII